MPSVRFNHQLATNLILYFAEREGGAINKLKAIKLIWLLDRYYLRVYGKLITNDSYYALPNGPVPSNTLDLINQSDFSNDIALEYAAGFLELTDNFTVKGKSSFNSSLFTKSVLRTMQKVYDTYGSLSPKEISAYSHEFPEWKKFEKELITAKGRYEMNLVDFFSSFDDKFGMFNDENSLTPIIEANKEMYLFLKELELTSQHG